ncbi:MAG: carboxymuconolactone decarboxylase family protein [Nitriliruptoraceae bacterium]
MQEYLPEPYTTFRDRYPLVAEATDDLGRQVGDAGPLADREQRLAKLGIAIGALAEGAVRANVRKGLDAGISVDEIRHVALLAITTAGFPTAIAAMTWIDEVVAARAEGAS